MEISRRRAACDAEQEHDAGRQPRKRRRPRSATGRARLRRRSGRAGWRRRRRGTQTLARLVAGRAHVQHSHRERQLDPRRRQCRAGREPLRHDAAAGQHGAKRHRTMPRLLRRRFIAGRELVVTGTSLRRGWLGSRRQGVAPRIFVDAGDVLGFRGRAARGLFGWGVARAARNSHDLRRGRAAAGYPPCERVEHRRLDGMGPCPGERLGRSVAAATSEALLRRGTAAGLVHARKRPRAVLAGEPLRSGRFGGGWRDRPERQRHPGGHERVAKNRQPGRDPTKRCVRVHGEMIPAAIEERKQHRNGGGKRCGPTRWPRSPGSRRGLVCDSPHKSPERKRRDPRRTSLTSSATTESPP